MASFFLPSSARLAGALRLQLLDAHFQPPRRHREFGAKLVLVGLDLRHRHRGGSFHPPDRQADRPAVDQGIKMSPNRLATRKPMPKYMAGSIMTGTPTGVIWAWRLVP